MKILTIIEGYYKFELLSINKCRKQFAFITMDKIMKVDYSGEQNSEMVLLNATIQKKIYIDNRYVLLFANKNRIFIYDKEEIQLDRIYTNRENELLEVESLPDKKKICFIYKNCSYDYDIVTKESKKIEEVKISAIINNNIKFEEIEKLCIKENASFVSLDIDNREQMLTILRTSNELVIFKLPSFESIVNMKYNGKIYSIYISEQEKCVVIASFEKIFVVEIEKFDNEEFKYIFENIHLDERGYEEIINEFEIELEKKMNEEKKFSCEKIEINMQETYIDFVEIIGKYKDGLIPKDNSFADFFTQPESARPIKYIPSLDLMICFEEIYKNNCKLKIIKLSTNQIVYETKAKNLAKYILIKNMLLLSFVSGKLLFVYLDTLKSYKIKVTNDKSIYYGLCLSVDRAGVIMYSSEHAFFCDFIGSYYQITNIKSNVFYNKIIPLSHTRKYLVYDEYNNELNILDDNFKAIVNKVLEVENALYPILCNRQPCVEFNRVNIISYGIYSRSVYVYNQISQKTFEFVFPEQEIVYDIKDNLSYLIVYTFWEKGNQSLHYLYYFDESLKLLKKVRFKGVIIEHSDSFIYISDKNLGMIYKIGSIQDFLGNTI